MKRPPIWLTHLFFIWPIFFVVIFAPSISESLQYTPVDEMFTEYYSDIPDLSTEAWELKVHGEVNQSMNFSYSEIQALPQTTVNATLKCIDGRNVYAIWRGVSIPTILNLVGLQPNATAIVFRGADNYSSSLQFEWLNFTNVILATHVNGEALPPEQGFPMKLVVPGYFGYKWVSWITEMEVIDDFHLGYWESVGWRDNAWFGNYEIPELVRSWSFHAIFLSITFYCGGIAWIGGLKKHFYKWGIFRQPKWYPKWVKTQNHHIILGIISISLSLVINIFWIIYTLNIKGDLEWGIHAIFAIIHLASIGGLIPTSIFKIHHRKKQKFNRKTPFTGHFLFSTLYLLSMMGAILTGLIFYNIT